jgi:hypothetical protein
MSSLSHCLDRNDPIPKDYAWEWEKLIQPYLEAHEASLIAGSWKYDILCRASGRTFWLNDTAANPNQFEDFTRGSYMLKQPNHIILVRLTGNMYDDVFTFLHELRHAQQLEEGIIVTDGKTYWTFDEYFDIEADANDFAATTLVRDFQK